MSTSQKYCIFIAKLNGKIFLPNITAVLEKCKQVLLDVFCINIVKVGRGIANVINIGLIYILELSSFPIIAFNWNTSNEISILVNRNFGFTLEIFLMQQQHRRNIDFTLQILAVNRKVFISNIAAVLEKYKHPSIASCIT